MPRIILLSSLPLLAAPAAAQPAPNPEPRTSPRAHWVLTAGVTGTPSQRRDNPGAASTDKMYVFGGRLGNATATVLNALYEFDGATWTLRTAEGAPGSPPARGGACVAWDPTRSRLVVFGGDDGTNLFGDSWEWDPLTNAWTNTTSSPAPSPRRWSAMAFDPVTGGMLLFGGETSTSPPTPDNETWLYTAGTWTQLAPGASPPARGMHSLVTRADFGDVFMCLGRDQTTTPQTRMLDAWKWDGASWVQFATNGTIPHGTTANQAVYDPLRRRVVVQGGQGISVPNTAGGGQYGDAYGGSPSGWCSEFDCLIDEWRLYGEPSFSTADPAIGRISRYFAAFVPALGKVYKVSGQNPSGVGTVTATAEYQATPVAEAPSLGMGCSGGGGLVTLTATAPNDRPWLGRIFVATAGNLASGAIPLGVIGTSSTPLPLSLLHPAGRAGCMLLADLDLVVTLANASGSATFAAPLPNLRFFAGTLLYLQVLQVELALPNISAITSSNALALTLGAL